VRAKGEGHRAQGAAPKNAEAIGRFLGAEGIIVYSFPTI